MDVRALVPAGAAALFVMFLVWKMWPSVRTPFQRRRDLDPRLLSLRQKAASAVGPARASALCEAGAISMQGGRQTAAFGYYLRAVRADAKAGDAIRGIARALARKPRSLERVLWRHLAHLEPAELRSPSTRATLEELAALYGRTRDRTREKALQNLLALTADPPA